jgi:DNA-binding transcriptional LysR family regulator
MFQELRACLEANGILDRVTHQLATQEDVLALLKADLGVAIIPIGAVEASGICCIPLKQLNLVRKVSVYTVAGRHRAIACATLFNTLRAADWGFDTRTKQQRRAHQ